MKQTEEMIISKAQWMSVRLKYSRKVSLRVKKHLTNKPRACWFKQKQKQKNWIDLFANSHSYFWWRQLHTHFEMSFLRLSSKTFFCSSEINTNLKKKIFGNTFFQCSKHLILKKTERQNWIQIKTLLLLHLKLKHHCLCLN